MSIEIVSGSQCDAERCRTIIHNGESCYCQSCWDGLTEKIHDLETDVQNLGEEIERVLREKR